MYYEICNSLKQCEVFPSFSLSFNFFSCFAMKSPHKTKVSLRDSITDRYLSNKHFLLLPEATPPLFHPEGASSSLVLGRKTTDKKPNTPHFSHGRYVPDRFKPKKKEKY